MDGSMSAPVPGVGTVKQSESKMRTVSRVYRMLGKCRRADKRWRPRAAEGVEFYFDRQWKAADRQRLEDRGQAVVTINRVKPTIRLIHGLVVVQPVDVLAKPVGRDDDGIAETATAALKYVNGVNDYKTLRELVYFDALTYGVGWCMTGLHVRDKDRRSEPVQYKRINPREIRWDPNSQEPDLSDARYVVWSRKVDLEEAQALYPKHATDLEKLTHLTDANLDGAEEETWDGIVNDTPPVHLWAQIREDYDNWDQSDKGGDQANPQVILHEVWERYPETVWLYEGADGVPCEFDGPDSEYGRQLMFDPSVVRFYEDTVFKVRYHVVCGPLLLVSDPSPYEHDRLPFVPCFAERDEHGDPVSAVESIKDIQREINHRHSKMLHELNRVDLVITQQAMSANGITTVEEAIEKAEKGNTVWIVETPGDVQYLHRGEMASQQFTLMQDAKAEIQATTGANDDLMGYSSSSKSGKAKELTMQQGQTMLRPLESNLRLFDKLVAQQGLALIQQAHTEEWVVRIRDDAGRDKFITLNQRVVDPRTGIERKLNTIQGMRFEYELDQMPWTPTLRQRTADMLNDMANNEADPIIRNALRLAAIQAADMPDKAKVLDIYGSAVEQADAMQQVQMAQAQQALAATQMGPPPGPANPEEGAPMVPDGAIPDNQPTPAPVGPVPPGLPFEGMM